VIAGYQANAVAAVRRSAPALSVPFCTSTMIPALEFGHRNNKVIYYQWIDW